MNDDPILFDIIGYTGEVSEADGPRVVGFFTDDWSVRAQASFRRWVAEREQQHRTEVEQLRRLLDDTTQRLRQAEDRPLR